MFAGVGILQRTAHSEHKVAIAHFPIFSVARDNWRVLLTPVKALVTEHRCTGLRTVSSSLILRSQISFPFPLLCSEGDIGPQGTRDGSVAGSKKKGAEGVVSLGRPFERKPGSRRLISREISGSGAGREQKPGLRSLQPALGEAGWEPPLD